MLKVLSFLNILLLFILELRIAYKSYKFYDMGSFYLLLFGALVILSMGVLIWVL